MVAIWTSVVAVGGTLLGAVVTHLFQRLAAARTERFARSEALRQERTATYSAFASAAEEYRHGQAGRWYRMVRGEDDRVEVFVEARDEAHRLRTVARQALYRVKLLTDDPEVVRAAEQAYERTRDVSTAGDQETHDALYAEAREAIEAFVTRAAPLTR
ncbi:MULTISPECIES: hypothetical protein [Streptomyces]|uniref:Uncharacterized protein n=2 Tax=Streptomyces TaxID=1883 RepID=A0A1V0U9K6_STRVN|nr:MULTISPECIES: hypothetical protein [Streptomyces]NEA11977.1 hypothetical protein [Streptomyces sp. SID10692]NEC40702.1 hypothetical protein [Streptomyces sp. SID8016]ARF61913.1 hypothetical protein B1H20_11225 [Streptomyces violaceoruber]KOG78552.1 hypothetical protein ADK33_26525 [Streptomyces griseus subsp. rhodochrous]KOU01772.1 hypothetical protein ADK88_30270 [Streptomyces sp. NRRL F-2295]